MNSKLKITLLGTGTSSGVPVLGCYCEVCRSQNPKDKRFRCAVLVETDHTRILIDAGPDIRMQLLRVPFRKLDGVLICAVSVSLEIFRFMVTGWLLPPCPIPCLTVSLLIQNFFIPVLQNYRCIP